MVDNLLKEQADPNIMDNMNLTPLGLALNLNYSGILKLILKYDNLINFASPQTSSLILVAIENLDVELAQQLLENGCNLNFARNSNTGENSLHLLMYKMY